MAKKEKLLLKILHAKQDFNINFKDLCSLLKSMGFNERIKGSRHIFSREDIIEIVNIQPKKKLSKPYQVKQIRNLIIKYKLGDIDND